MNPVQRFIDELNRRNVFRAGAAYLVLVWLVVQVADILLETFAAPDWVMQLIVLAAAIGLPVALVLSWAYEITTEGVKPTSEVDPELSITKLTGRKLDFVIIGFLAIALVVFAVERFVWHDRTTTPETEVLTMAVLPFTFSNEQIAPFYSRLADDLKGQLRRNSAVRMASADAVAAVPENTNLPLVASRLGVQFLVLGAIELLDNNLAIAISVFDAERNDVILKEDFSDAQLPQSNVIVAHHVLSALGQIPSERQVRPIDPEAYALYLRALQEIESPDWRDSEARKLLEQAIDMDPQFALAYAALCRYLTSEYHQSESLDAFRQAEQHCFRAWTLDNESPDVLIAMGSLYRKSGQTQKARESYRAALELNPNEYYAKVRLIETIRDESPDIAEAQYKLLIAEHPGSPEAYASLQQFLFFRGRYKEAVEYAQTAYKLYPSDGYAQNLSSDLMLAGEFASARAFCEEQVANGNRNPDMLGNLATAMFFERDYSGAAELYRLAIDEAPDSVNAHRNLSDALWHLKGADHTQSVFLTVIELGKKHLAVNPDDAANLSSVALAYASIGDRVEFRSNYEKALDLDSNDPQVPYTIAVGYSRLGDKESAREFARQALDLGFPVALLNADPDIAATGVRF
jgi:tetratricopeptide (TPR) repeat protein